MRIVLGFFALIAVLASAPTARADTIAILTIEGPQANAIQKSLQKVLRARGYEVVLAESQSDEAGVTASISGKVSKSKKRWRVALELRRGVDGESLATTTLQANNPRGLPSQVEKLIWRRFRKALNEAKTQEPETPPEQAVAISVATNYSDKPAITPADSSDEPEASSVSTAPADPLDPAKRASRRIDASVALGPRLVGRRFNYKDDLFAALTTYDVPATAALGLEADYYPLEQFGVAASYSYTPSFNSALNGDSNEPFPTTSRGFMVGARARQHVAMALARLDIDYGGHNFRITGPAAMKPPIPNVRYRFLRVGGGATMSLRPRVSASVQAGYRHLLSTGEIESQSYFPRLKAAAVDARLSVGMALGAHWHVELSATMERYFFSMNPEVGDALIAGGAADLYRGAQILLKYRL